MPVVQTLVKIKMVLGLDVEIKICNSSPGSHEYMTKGQEKKGILPRQIMHVSFIY
jgi:hypothetical protein